MVRRGRVLGDAANALQSQQECRQTFMEKNKETLEACEAIFDQAVVAIKQDHGRVRSPQLVTPMGKIIAASDAFSEAKKPLA
eukprot:8916696-Alexandrium_andersonii.AAC.2